MCIQIKNKCLSPFLFCLFFLGSICCYSKELQTIDRTYEDNIKSVLLYPYSTNITDVISPPILSLYEQSHLFLSFDELGNQADNYYVKIINCNKDWSISYVNAILYLNEYNEFQITERLPSYNTRIPYFHYTFHVPKTKVSGNFLLVVYRAGDEEDLILTKRFMVYENEVTTTPSIKFPMNGNERNTSQQVDFTINFKNSIQNPLERMHVVIRQNFNWTNTIEGLQPSFRYDNTNTFEYKFFNNENVFNGLNEYRFFDLRSLISYGMNVSKIIQTTTNNEVLLGYDKTRSQSIYGTSFDINGCYVPEHYETKGFETEPDYAQVIFTLEIPKENISGRIFIVGSLSHWNLSKEFEMKWDEEYKVYTCTAILKQGYYNYAYALLPDNKEKIDYTFFEGNFSQTQNYYDIITYYRGMGDQFDRIVGYKAANYLNSR